MGCTHNDATAGSRPVVRAADLGGGHESRTVKPDDSYVTKIVKYVPAESVALATGFFAAFSPRGWWMLLALVLFAAANFCYLYGAARVNDQRRDTNPHFYVLASAAFVLWAVATIGEVATLGRTDRNSRGRTAGLDPGRGHRCDSDAGLTGEAGVAGMAVLREVGSA